MNDSCLAVVVGLTREWRDPTRYVDAVDSLAAIHKTGLVLFTLIPCDSWVPDALFETLCARRIFCWALNEPKTGRVSVLAGAPGESRCDEPSGTKVAGESLAALCDKAVIPR